MSTPINSMAKITELTSEQRDALKQFQQEWLSIGLRAGAADLDAVTPVIHDFYKRIGKPPPKIVRCTSPLIAELVINLLGSTLGSSLGSSLRSSLRSTLGSSLYSALGSTLDSTLDSTLRSTLRSTLDSTLRSSLDSTLDSTLRSSLGSSLYSALGSTLDSTLYSALGSALYSALGSALRSARLKYFGTSFWGSIDSFWIAYYLFPQRHLKADMYEADALKILEGWAQLAQNCFWWYPLEDVCLVCDRPETHFDAEKRLHNAEGMAIQFPDGWGVWSWHGVMVTEQIVLRPETLTVEQIDAERNSEVRRSMLEQDGVLERYIRDSGAVRVAHDERYGTIWRRDYTDKDSLFTLEVVNRTPESDGTFKHYWETFDGSAYNGDASRIPQAANASMFRRSADSPPYFRDYRDYQPVSES